MAYESTTIIYSAGLRASSPRMPKPKAKQLSYSVPYQVYLLRKLAEHYKTYSSLSFLTLFSFLVQVAFLVPLASFCITSIEGHL